MKFRLAARGWILLVIFEMILAGCAHNQDTGSEETKLNLLESEWDQVLKEASGQTVNLYMWGENDSINRYIDEWLRRGFWRNRMLP